MPITFKILRSANATSDEFHQAFHCAVTSIESILFDYDFNVTAYLPEIRISPVLAAGQSVSPTELARLIKGAFVDAEGMLYPEFAQVRKGT
ncbi:hypothetical protein [Spongiibacter marinus]|uniref:hypothetical protein n=1 Tax=Spongiibacter marinus TaxID=354246 RepID=UPI0019603DF4|nr:hypothetical protein [Spongiibacter marinus]MBM7424672.1 hypothetical protein [Spongiibacter marinus]